MVKTGVAIAGGVISIVGVGLMLGSALMQTFVVVELPGVKQCSVDFLGTIGVFTSSYDPACTKGTTAWNTFSIIEPIHNKPTTEFPLLFPAQTRFGGALGTVGKFTTCEEFYAENGPANKAIVNTVMDTVVRKVNTGIETGFADTAALLKDVKVGLNPGISSLVSGRTGLYFKGVNKTVVTFVRTGQGLLHVTVPKICKNIALVTDFNKICERGLVGGGAASIHSELLSVFQSCTSGNPGVFCDDGTLNANDISLLSQYAASFATVGAPNPYDGLFGISITKTFVQQNWASLKSALPTLATAVFASDKTMFNSLKVAELLLSLCPNTTYAKCQNFYTPPASPTNPATNDGLCTLVALDMLAAGQAGDQSALFPDDTSVGLTTRVGTAIASLKASTPLTFKCTYQDAAQTFEANAATLAPSFGMLFGKSLDAASIGLIMRTVTGCPSPATTVQCFDNLIKTSSSIPNNLMLPGWLPAFAALSKACIGANSTTVPSKVVCSAQLSDPARLTPALFFMLLAGSSDPVQKMAGTLFGLCTSGVANVASPGTPIMDLAKCINALKLVIPTQPKLSEPVITLGLKNGLSALVPGATQKDRIEACNKNEKDISVFKKCQIMVPIAITIAAIGAVISFAAVSSKKKKIFALVGGALSTLGGVLMLAALLLLRFDAPVYKTVGGVRIDGTPYYTPGTAQSLGLSGMSLSMVGGLITIGSTLCNHAVADSNDDLTLKVEGTY